MANYTKLTDTLAATEGSAYITVNGQNRQMFEVSSIDAHITYKVQEKQTLGHRMTQHKIIGATGEGSGTFYFMNSQMLREFVSYMKNGIAPEVTTQIVNEDPQSTIGRQSVALYHMILNTVPVAYLDDDSEDPITFDSDFTFDDLGLLEQFQTPENFR